jgi:hypothetical protein
MRSVIPEILAALESYLDARDREWELLPLEDKRPTLPNINGRVNVRAITIALGLRQSQEQHFYKHQELADPINVMAKAQGLRGINSRELDDAADRVHAERLNKSERHSTDLSRSLAECAAVRERQRLEIGSLREQLAMLEDMGMGIRTKKVG